MINFIKTLYTGQFSILAYFFTAIIVLYIPWWIFFLTSTWEKAKDFKKQHPDAAMVFIKMSKINDLLTVTSIDGSKPVVFSKGIQYGFYLLPGEHNLTIEYSWTKINFFNKLFGPVYRNSTESIVKMRFQVLARPCKKYSIYYDHDKKKFIFEDI